MKSDQSVTRRPYNKKVHRHLFLAISYLDLCILEWLTGRPLAIKAEIKTLQNSGCYKSLTIQSSRFSFGYISRAHHQHIFIALIHNLWRPFSLIVCVTVTWFSFLFFLETFIYFYDSGDKIPFFSSSYTLTLLFYVFSFVVLLLLWFMIVV
jgi:hypothetical protein